MFKKTMQATLQRIKKIVLYHRESNKYIFKTARPSRQVTDPYICYNQTTITREK